MPPETIAGRYRVVREVGRGGMGAVYLCHDEVLGREVAVKRMGGLAGESSPHLARALREARTAAALTHPNVVSIFDVIEEHERVWLVMEYLPSRTLSRILADEGALPTARAARVGAQVADGLAAAHARGTIHRDVKPGNILVAERDLAKISDFGIARTIGEEQLTQTGLVSGTPLYFSPQLARGQDPTPADDVWALGATLYAAVEGQPPWPHKPNPIAMLAHIASNDPPEPRRAGPLAALIGQMMAADPARRPDMTEVAARLHRLAHDRPPVLPAAAAAAATATAAETDHAAAEPAAPAPVPPAPPPQATSEFESSGPVPLQTAPPQERPPRRHTGLLLLAVAVVVLLAAVGAALATGMFDTDEAPTTGPTTTSPSAPAPTSSREPSPTASDTEPPTTSAPPPPATTSTSTSPAAASTPAAFIEAYYALLPEDTRTAWSLLASSIQARVGSYGRYRGFWMTIDSVVVEDTVAVDDDTVDVTLTYTSARGIESETRRIDVAPAGDSYLIVGDAVPG